MRVPVQVTHCNPDEYPLFLLLHAESVVNPVRGTNWSLPRHTSNESLGRQTAPVYFSKPHASAPTTQHLTKKACACRHMPGTGVGGGGAGLALNRFCFTPAPELPPRARTAVGQEHQQ